jgi:hypothetical protein
MIHIQTMKVADAITDTVATDGVLGTAIIDTNGYNYLTLIITLGAIGSDLAGCAVTQSIASNMADPSNVIVFETTTDVAGNTNALSTLDTNESVRYDINLIGKDRYFKLTLTAGATGTAEASYVALLTRAEIGLDDNSVGDGGTDFRFRA